MPQLGVPSIPLSCLSSSMLARPDSWTVFAFTTASDAVHTDGRVRLSCESEHALSVDRACTFHAFAGRADGGRFQQKLEERAGCGLLRRSSTSVCNFFCILVIFRSIFNCPGSWYINNLSPFCRGIDDLLFRRVAIPADQVIFTNPACFLLE